MATIFKVAAGVIIGFLVLQIYYNYAYDQKRSRVEESLIMASKFDVSSQYTKNAISSYYRKHGVIPSFISDVRCKRGKQCAAFKHGETYYLSKADAWMSFEPFLEDDQLKFRCSISKMGGIDWQITKLASCRVVENFVIPNLQKPSFECSETSNHIEELICSSDRLIDSDLKMVQAYAKLKQRMSENGIEWLKVEQLEFIEKREAKCNSIKCVDKLTRERITILQSY